MTVNITVTMDGTELERLTREDYLYAIGSGEFTEMSGAITRTAR